MLRLLYLILFFSLPLYGAEYYIDYRDGDDNKDGGSPAQAWQHCPGDRAANGNAQTHKPKPGDVFRFKGGVRYYGSINVTASGTREAPIILDGNLDGGYGTGPAIIDGSMPINSWTRCTSAAEARGNPKWQQIYYSDLIPSSSNWRLTNLHDLDQSYPLSQDPNMPDPFYQEMARHYYKTQQSIREAHDFKIEVIGMKQTRGRHIISMFDNSRTSAVINDLHKGSVKVTFPETRTISSIGISPQPRYANPSRIRITADDKELITIEPAVSGKKLSEQRFELPAPTNVNSLQFYFEGAHPKGRDPKPVWGAIQKLAAYNADGDNVLFTTRRSYYRDTKRLTQTDPDHWDGAVMAIYGSPAQVYYHPIKAFHPERNEVEISLFNRARAGGGSAFSILNSLHVLDQPGEYVVSKPDPEHLRIYFWPKEGLENLRISRHPVGIHIAASWITVQGIHTRGQGGSKNGSGISVYKRGGAGIHIKACDIALCRGSAPALYIAGTDHSLVEDTYVHHNSLHTKGFVARILDGIIIRNCKFERNTSTALDYYTLTNGAVLDCLVIDNQGMHANGLTFYAGCKNILVEGNEVYDGNTGITCQDGENLLIRNNIIESRHGNGMAVWDGKVFNNIIICNNVLRGHKNAEGKFVNALFGGHPQTTNIAAYNNIIIGGFAGNMATKVHFDHNLFVDLSAMTESDMVDHNKHIASLDEIFIDAASRDYRLQADSPAIGAGMPVPGIALYDKRGNAWGDKPDIGPYRADSEGGFRSGATVTAFKAPDDFVYQPPSIKPPDYTQPAFSSLDDEPIVRLEGAQFSAQGGGKVRIKKEARNIYGWDDKDHWLEWAITVPEAGDYEICLKQSTATISKRSFFINGTAIDKLQQHDMTYTGGWSKWTDHYLPAKIPLNAGDNIFKINGEGGSLNVIELRVYQISQ